MIALERVDLTPGKSKLFSQSSEKIKFSSVTVDIYKIKTQYIVLRKWKENLHGTIKIQLKVLEYFSFPERKLTAYLMQQINN